MLKLARSILKFTLVAILLFAGKTLISTFFYYPFDRIDPILLFLLWKVVYKNNISYLWVVVPVFVMIDLFSAQPYGLISVSTLVSILLIRMIFYRFITTFSWYSILLLSASGIMVYKALILSFAAFSPVFSNRVSSININDISSGFFEIGINSAIFLFFYALNGIFKPKKRYNYTF